MPHERSTSIDWLHLSDFRPAQALIDLRTTSSNTKLSTANLCRRNILNKQANNDLKKPVAIQSDFHKSIGFHPTTSLKAHRALENRMQLLLHSTSILMMPLLMQQASLKDQRIDIAFQKPAPLKAAPPSRFRARHKANDCGHGFRAPNPKGEKKSDSLRLA